jgi:hypothetical protein
MTLDNAVEYKKVPLDFGDLANPVSASAYFDVRNDCWGLQSHCRTITEDNYRPRIFLDHAVWSSLFPEEDSECYISILDDPPTAFAPVEDGESRDDAPPLPQITHGHSGPQHMDDGTSAKPGGTAMPPVATQTATAMPHVATQTALSIHSNLPGAESASSGSHTRNADGGSSRSGFQHSTEVFKGAASRLDSSLMRACVGLGVVCILWIAS